MQLEHNRADVERVARSILQAAAAFGYDERALFALRLAYEEAVANAFMHGCRGLVRPRIRVRYAVRPDAVEITVADPGPGFDPETVPDPRLDDNLHKPHGRGILLMRAFMSSVQFDCGGSQVTLRYLRDGRHTAS